MDDRENLLARRALLLAYVAATADLHRVVDITTTTAGGRDAVVAALRNAFGFTEVQADAVMLLQIGRLIAEGAARVRKDLAQVDEALARGPQSS